MDNNGGNKQSLWKRIIIIFVLGAVVFAGYYYFASGKKSANAPFVSQSTPAVQDSPSAAPSAEKNRIILNSNGFAPSPLTIKTGDSVSWVNQSGKTATVDSDTHPTHTAYTPLNLGSFDDGATLSLTFDQAGSYGYHNHYNPSVRGTIIVE